MVKLLVRLLFIVTLLFGCSVVQPTEAAIPRQDVGFVVVDPDGLADRETLSEWRSVVKWAYHFPYYRFTDRLTERNMATTLRGPRITVSKRDLAELAAKHDLGALVVVKVRDLSERMTHYSGNPFWEDNGPYVELAVDVDLYVYKTATDQFMKQRVRKYDTVDMGNYDTPREIVKWKLCDLVNKMEKRPLIRG